MKYGDAVAIDEQESNGGGAMMHITEDTPPDMLAGAMDLAICLPDGRDVNMSVERSTPMMDLLVQVTTAHKLRPSDHIIQAIDMATAYDRVLPYKPNTPIGALDTQQIRVLAKGRSLPARSSAPSQQPFESTFRLQVHLPRNQFAVIRVGKSCLLEDIMKKVCEEKNLDCRKYEFRHPGNIDQVLDPRRTLSDYELTEVTVVPRGSGRLPQTLSSSDIMALQREEERRKMQAKTGGGVLNLIFRRGKNSMGSGSISSDTRSISPTQSEDSRSVTPPAVQPPQILPPVVQEQAKPKAPLRKRRPAPKPPQPSKNEKALGPQEADQTQKHENGLTICHSRNSSDSSGYHEASILSDNCNMSLPRRPKSTVINSSGDSALGMDKVGDFSKSMENLSKMTLHSKSTTSLTNAGRKKKAPPPPPSLKSATSLANIATCSTGNPEPKPHTEPNTPVVTSIEPIVEAKPAGSPSTNINRPTPPKPQPRTYVPVPVPRTVKPAVEQAAKSVETVEDNINALLTNSNKASPLLEHRHNTAGRQRGFQIEKSLQSLNEIVTNDISDNNDNSEQKTIENDLQIDNINFFDQKEKYDDENDEIYLNHLRDNQVEINDVDVNKKYEEIFSLKSSSGSSTPSIHSVVSLRSMDSVPTFLGNGNIKKWSNVQNLDGISVDSSISKDWAVGDSDADTCPTPQNSTRASISSLNSNNTETKLDQPNTPTQTSNTSHKSDYSKLLNSESIIASPTIVNENLTSSTPIKDEIDIKPKEDLTPLKVNKDSSPNLTEEINELETEWQYQLPSPPKEFRDNSPTNFTDITNYDTVTINGLSESLIPPPIFDSSTKDMQSETDTVSEVDADPSKILTSKYLSLETLEKRKSLVLERELSSLKIAQTEYDNKSNPDTLRNQKNNLITEVEKEKHNRSNKNTTLSRSNSQSIEKTLQTESTLPNFKITTYDQPKSNINIFEDDTIRSNVDKQISNLQKRNSIADVNVFYHNYKNENTFIADKRNSLSSISTENLRKMHSLDDEVFKKPLPPKFGNLNGNVNGEHISRSESFSQQNGWNRMNPVKRSKSQVSLEKYKEENRLSADKDEFQKSSSMWNVSGLQSLEVMRMILPKLENSPPSTPEVNKTKEQEKPLLKTTPMRPEKVSLNKTERQNSITSIKQESQVIEKVNETPVKPVIPTKVIQEPTPKVYQYRGPPSINLGTWSERPKSQISLKEDKDYKISNISTMKAKFSSQTNFNAEPVKKQENNVASVNIRVNGESKDQVGSGKINIKVNSEPSKIINQSPGNVIIKIGNTNEELSKHEPKNFYSRFLNQTTATGYRKPLGNINGMDKPRPRSIAFDSSCPDISRVPVVRAVELKKPFKEVQNKSITQITSDDLVQNGDERFHIPEYKQEIKSNTLGNRYSSIYVSSENVNNNKSEHIYSKPVSRVNSFAFTRPTNMAPVVKGFRVDQNVLYNKPNSTQWNGNHCGTLPSKPTSHFNPTFSQNNLKRTNNLNNIDKFINSNNSTAEKVVLRNTSNRSIQPNRKSTGCFNTVGLPNSNVPHVPQPPAPPQLPKIAAVTKKSSRQTDADPRDQLLSAIKNFGGKAGLKPIK